MGTQNSTAIANLMNPAIAEMKSANARRRKQMKPAYARFKASIKYKNNFEKKPMFSYDWNKIYIDGLPRSLDSEWLGLQTILLWILKQAKSGTLESVTIWMTFRPDKKTDVMDYDTLILSYHHSKNIDELKPIPELTFPDGHKVDLEKMLPVKIAQEQERERMKNKFSGMRGGYNAY